ncbi:sensor histidine kinase [Chenggangzhangella methanolivorans]|uniref:histidine kinase n=1 Tax=Chenggangzhangella methanolivorans TaxID=1437009 RepID=A0A9E6R8A5_9HYPH|nr:PAS domain-containing sensor histidine kinase [Chenggangzhangella methanolivorans]QZN99321.1 PAS domain-containing protein [Chenggangzhangella methanolivorans]
MKSQFPGPWRSSVGDAYEQGAIWDEILAKDWSATSLGPVEAWPIALRTILRTVISSRQPMCVWWGPDLLQFHNEAFLPILADRAKDAIGAPIEVLWADVWTDVEPLISEALAGRGASVNDMPLDMMRFGVSQPTTWTFFYSPVYDDAGEVAGVLNVTTDTTAQVEAGRRQRAETDALTEALGDANVEIGQQREAARLRIVVQRELSHRLKNAYAMIQSIVNQTLNHAESLQEAKETVGARIKALSLAQDVLMESSSDDVEVSAVVAAALTPHQEAVSRIIVSGQKQLVGSQQGLGLALGVHELATNAAKYGSLSTDAGSVRLSWASEGGGFRFEWAEEGGPPAAQPVRQGFGTRLLKRVVPAYFNGSAKLDYAEGGFRYSLAGKPDDEPAPSL